VSAETDTPGGAISAEQAAQTQEVPPAEPTPTPTVSHDEQTASRPPGSPQPEGGVPVTERPEALVGGAFAGGLLLAIVLRKIVG
jgi:hypothetical protein